MLYLANNFFLDKSDLRDIVNYWRLSSISLPHPTLAYEIRPLVLQDLAAVERRRGSTPGSYTVDWRAGYAYKNQSPKPESNVESIRYLFAVDPTMPRNPVDSRQYTVDRMPCYRLRADHTQNGGISYQVVENK